jgi:hypothetical protein
MRVSGVSWLFIDGVPQASFNFVNNVDNDEAIYFGVDESGVSDTNGYMREIRVRNDAYYSDYTSTGFTPSQTGFTLDSATKIYIKGTENNGVTTFIEQNGKTVTTGNNTVIKYTEDYRSCIFKDETGKFPYPVGSAKVDFFTVSGSGVGYFDGTNSYLTAPNSADFEFGSGDFTIEYYQRDIPTNAGFTIGRDATTSYAPWLIGTGAIYMSSNGSSWDIANGKTGPYAQSGTYNNWFHGAVVRSGNNFYSFANGTLLDSWTSAASFVANSGALSVGKTQTVNWLKANVDNIRISKGVARYTSTFNCPEFRTFTPRAILI